MNINDMINEFGEALNRKCTSDTNIKCDSTTLCKANIDTSEEYIMLSHCYQAIECMIDFLQKKKIFLLIDEDSLPMLVLTQEKLNDFLNLILNIPNSVPPIDVEYFVSIYIDRAFQDYFISNDIKQIYRIHDVDVYHIQAGYNSVMCELIKFTNFKIKEYAHKHFNKILI